MEDSTRGRLPGSLAGKQGEQWLITRMGSIHFSITSVLRLPHKDGGSKPPLPQADGGFWTCTLVQVCKEPGTLQVPGSLPEPFPHFFRIIIASR